MQESRTITRKSASNLALAFVLLPKAKRDSMSALYAFCREVDDVADDESLPVPNRREQLAAWRADVRRACGTESPQFPVNRELQHVIRQYRLPFELFDELLKGIEMDLDIDFERLSPCPLELQNPVAALEDHVRKLYAVGHDYECPIARHFAQHFLRKEHH